MSSESCSTGFGEQNLCKRWKQWKTTSRWYSTKGGGDQEEKEKKKTNRQCLNALWCRLWHHKGQGLWNYSTSEVNFEKLQGWIDSQTGLQTRFPYRRIMTNDINEDMMLCCANKLFATHIDSLLYPHQFTWVILEKVSNTAFKRLIY